MLGAWLKLQQPEDHTKVDCQGWLGHWSVWLGIPYFGIWERVGTGDYMSYSAPGNPTAVCVEVSLLWLGLESFCTSSAAED